MKSKLTRPFWGVFLVSVCALILTFEISTRDVREQLDRGVATTAESDIQQLSSAIKLYRMEHGAYPTSTEGLDAVPYIGDLLDPWGNPYVYRIPGRSRDFDVYTLGADGEEGGSGLDADIGTWAP